MNNDEDSEPPECPMCGFRHSGCEPGECLNTKDVPSNVTITCHHRLDENDDGSEAWEVSDDGGEFDDESFNFSNFAADDVQARHDYYVKLNPAVAIKIRNT